eukprot:g20088.t1
MLTRSNGVVPPTSTGQRCATDSLQERMEHAMPDIARITSEELTVEVSALGAEMQSLRTADGRSWLWNGDPSFWTGRSPILFPIVGKAPGNRVAVDGRTYEMAQHGFARRSTFVLSSSSADACRFELQASDATRAVYPFEFLLAVEHRVAGRRLTVVAEVENRGADPLPFGLGFHPAFLWPLPGAADAAHTIILDNGAEPLLTRLEDGLIGEGTLPSPFAKGRLTLAPAQFEADAMIFAEGAGTGLTYAAESGPSLHFAFENLPNLALWQKPGTPFLCIEPWHGMAAEAGGSPEIAARPYALSLAAGQVARFAFSALDRVDEGGDMAATEPVWTFAAMFLPFLAAALAPVLASRFGARAAWIVALAPALAFWHFCGFLGEIAAGEVATGGYAWAPSFNLSFSWFIDGLSLVFALLITGIGTLILIYSGGYMKGHPQLGRFLSFILLFMGSMLGLVLSDSFLMLFVYWEMTSITSFLLIGFDHEREAARRAALQALVVTGGGGLCLLAGLVFLWNITGVTQLSLLVHLGDGLRESPFYLATLILVLGGAFTKSAQFPFHFWLPNAMEAPTPVSAYLHSATMVKAGVYLLMRLHPVMGGTPAWEILLPFFGGVTLIAGTLIGIRQTDLKLMLAYTTMASLGLLVMLTGFGAPHAIEAAVLYLVAHSLFKGALFMVAGSIDHETGTRQLPRLAGLRTAMPVTFAAALLAACSMGGMPLFAGFLAKEEIYAALAEGNPRAVFFTGLAVVGNGLMFAIAFAVGLKPFAGRATNLPRSPHEAPVALWLGPVLLSACGLVAGLGSDLLHRYLSSPMASAITGKPAVVTITTLPHVGMPLALSLATIVFGLLVYWQLDKARAVMVQVLENLGPGPDRWFDHALAGLVRAAALVTRITQPGRLEIYITATFILVAVALLVPLVLFDELPSWPVWPNDLLVQEGAFFLIAALGVAAVLRSQDRLTAIVSLGIQGFAVAVIFLLFGAPDLSFTQFMVETLSVVILTLAMTRLKLTPTDHRPVGQLVFDAAVAIACGLGFALLLLKSVERPFDLLLTDFFNSYSKAIAHGANVVNVIIVDFRGTDTLGEISVVMITGLAVLALIKVPACFSRRCPVSCAFVDRDVFRYRRLSRGGRLDHGDRAVARNRAGARRRGGRPLMETLFAALIGLFFSAAIYLMLSKQTVRILLGIVLLGNAVNLLLFTSGRITREIPPIVPETMQVLPAAAANPLPQALILTAIVISFSFFAFLLVLTYRAFEELGTDNTDEMRLAEPRDEPLPPIGY